MALIRCSECGHEVSDKASTCPNCGCPIDKDLVCSECGNSLNPNDIICPKCGNPIKGNAVVGDDKPKARYVLFSLIIALLLGGGYFAYTHFIKSYNHTDVNAVSSDTVRGDADMSEQVDEAERTEEERKIEAARQSYIEREQKREEQEIGWLYCTWQCNIDGGAYLKISINATNLTEVMYIPSQGETKNVRSYYIDGDRLCTDKTKYRIDRANKRLLGDDGTPFSRVSASSNGTVGNNGAYNRDSRVNSNADSRIARLERKAQDDINELNAMVSAGRMHPATLMYLKQNLPRELTELMEYYSNQGNSTKYNDYAYKRRVVMGVFKDLGI